MPGWGLLCNGMNGGDLDRGDSKTGWWRPDRACVRAAAAFPPHSLGRGVKCAHTGVEPPHTSGDAVRLLWPLQRAWPQTAGWLPVHGDSIHLSVKLHCVWRAGIDREVHTLRYKWRGKVLWSGADQLMERPLIVSGGGGFSSLLVHSGI